MPILAGDYNIRGEETEFEIPQQQMSENDSFSNLTDLGSGASSGNSSDSESDSGLSSSMESNLKPFTHKPCARTVHLHKTKHMLKTTQAANAKPDEFQFLERIHELLMEDGVREHTNINSKVLEFQHPEELKTKLNYDISMNGESDDELLNLCKKTIKYSIKTGHPNMYNQLGAGGFDQYGVAGSWLTDTMNTSAYTYEMAPVFTLVEASILKKMRTCIGWENGDGDGIFAPGGSLANMYSINLARHKMFPEIKKKGSHACKPCCIFVSSQCHYSMMKSCSFLGMGSDNCIGVKCDEHGKLIPSELEKAIEQAKSDGLAPIAVLATAGTTVIGAFDPIEEMAEIAERHNLWFHVDSAWGGGALLSKKWRYLLKGIERADSVTWNPHKLMGATQQCSAFLTKHEGLLQAAHSYNAKYLFQKDKFYDVSYDTGDKTIQCGRRVDCFKLWLSWKARGDAGFEKKIDQAFDNSRHLAERCRTTPGFRLMLDPECTNVCFWYIPPSMRGQEETPEWWSKLNTVAPKIKQRMMEKGSLLVCYQQHEQYVNFFRMVVISDRCFHKDMDFIIEEIDRLGRDL